MVVLTVDQKVTLMVDEWDMSKVVEMVSQLEMKWVEHLGNLLVGH
jgi:hypothetical protein